MEAEVWRLHAAADGALLGRLTVFERDFPWINARLTATPAFEALRPLFREEARLARHLAETDEDVDTWEDAYAGVRAAVRLVTPDGVRVPEFLLHIDGDEAWWRYSDEPFDECVSGPSAAPPRPGPAA
jgi:hypothetical protein